ncbi:MAG: hypothetical protein F6K50_12615 [Moorea sp. SIO3I7]|uniref:hypothetical protein n=1 Tax=Moorena sp. SIO3I8 TaxID=2607833 RepID=UPI0013C09F2C|nr:hypothetical protein [Moorena sp. SIO3I8]NEN96345.1 hypothetical protein [Moorena sp. SIO3I7]NEO06918.1 hypothetical protein [Moorena sp. SIO3I8]
MKKVIQYGQICNLNLNMHISQGRQYAFLSIIFVTLIIANMLEIRTMTEESGTSSGGGMTSGGSIDANSLPEASANSLPEASANSLPEASATSKDVVQEIPLGFPMSSENFRVLKRNAEQPSLHDKATQVDEDE